MFGFIKKKFITSFFDQEIERCITEGRTESLLNNIKFESARKYAVYNGTPTVDHWGNEQEPSDVYLVFDKEINGEIYKITFRYSENGGTHLTVHTPEQEKKRIKNITDKLFNKECSIIDIADM